jgi:peptidyl-prolyl cis-trans isomerase C
MTDEPDLPSLPDEPAEPDEPDEPDRPPQAPSDRGPSRLAMVVVAVVALLAGAGTAIALGRKDPCPAKGDALEVEGRGISTERFERRIELLRALYDVRPPTEPEQLAAFKGDAAKGMAQAVLVSQDVAERKLQAAEKTVRDALDRFIAQRYPQGGHDQFVQALGTYGVSEADVLGELRQLLETSNLFQAVTSDVTVSEEQVASTFEARKEQLAVPERRHLRHLVVPGESDARRALERIRGPERFEAVARAVSLDTSTRETGGDLGTVARAQLDPAFGAAAFDAAEGATFGPVQTKNGWHVGLVVEVTPGRPVTLDEIRDSLRDTLTAEARLAKWRAHLAERIRTADACYAKGNRPADPKAPPADVTPRTLDPAPVTTATTGG